MIRWLKKIYKDYFKVYTEDWRNPLFSERHPEMLIIFYRGKVRKKIIDTQYAD